MTEGMPLQKSTDKVDSEEATREADLRGWRKAEEALPNWRTTCSGIQGHCVLLQPTLLTLPPTALDGHWARTPGAFPTSTVPTLLGPPPPRGTLTSPTLKNHLALITD